MTYDEQSIRELHTDWIAAVNAGDMNRLLGWITDDVVLLNPGGEPLGREGFIQVFTDAHKEVLLHCESVLDEVVVAGDIAFARSRDRLTVTPRTSSQTAPPSTTHLSGHRLTIYRKHPDGRWLLARDAHTLTARDN